jgi:hypothetical protein
MCLNSAKQHYRHRSSGHVLFIINFILFNVFELLVDNQRVKVHCWQREDASERRRSETR